MHVLLRSLRFPIVSNRREVYLRLIQAYGTVSILLACIYYLYPPLKLGRGVFLIGFISAPIVLVVWRTIFLRLSALPRFAERTLLIGNGLLTESIMAELSYRPILGLRIVGQLRSFENLNGSFDSNSREKQIAKS